MWKILILLNNIRYINIYFNINKARANINNSVYPLSLNNSIILKPVEQKKYYIFVAVSS